MYKRRLVTALPVADAVVSLFERGDEMEFSVVGPLGRSTSVVMVGVARRKREDTRRVARDVVDFLRRWPPTPEEAWRAWRPAHIDDVDLLSVLERVVRLGVESRLDIDPELMDAVGLTVPGREMEGRWPLEVVRYAADFSADEVRTAVEAAVEAGEVWTPWVVLGLTRGRGGSEWVGARRAALDGLNRMLDEPERLLRGFAELTREMNSDGTRAALEPVPDGLVFELDAAAEEALTRAVRRLEDRPGSYVRARRVLETAFTCARLRRALGYDDSELGSVEAVRRTLRLLDSPELAVVAVEAASYRLAGPRRTGSDRLELAAERAAKDLLLAALDEYDDATRARVEGELLLSVPKSVPSAFDPEWG